MADSILRESLYVAWDALGALFVLAVLALPVVPLVVLWWYRR